MKWGLRRLVLLTAVVISMLGLSFQAQGATTSTASSTSDSSMTSQAMSDALESVPPIDNQLSGIWITGSPDAPVINVGYTSTTPKGTIDSTISALEKAGVPDAQVQLDEQKYTRAQLLSFYNTVTSATASGKLDNSGITSVSIDSPTNQISITTSSGDSKSQDSAKTSMSDLLPAGTFEVDPTPMNPQGASVYDYPPWFAGTRIRNVDQNVFGNCSAGFIVWNGNSDWRAGTTAGHCSKNGDDFYAGGLLNQYVGWGATNLFRDTTEAPQTLDATLIPLSIWGDATRKIYPGPTQVSGKVAPSDLVSGFQVCEFGQASAHVDCGSIFASWPTALWMSYTNINTGNENFKWVYQEFCSNTLGQPGDSGGPTYHERPDDTVHAAGLTSAVLYTKDSEGNKHYYASCAVAMGSILDKWGLQLWQT